jgi:hypothetical protein
MKLYINDPDMKLAAKAAEKMKLLSGVSTAAEANGGKTGGGCGCN